MWNVDSSTSTFIITVKFHLIIISKYSVYLGNSYWYKFKELKTFSNGSIAWYHHSVYTRPLINFKEVPFCLFLWCVWLTCKGCAEFEIRQHVHQTRTWLSWMAYVEKLIWLKNCWVESLHDKMIILRFNKCRTFTYFPIRLIVGKCCVNGELALAVRGGHDFIFSLLFVFLWIIYMNDCGNYVSLTENLDLLFGLSKITVLSQVFLV